MKILLYSPVSITYRGGAELYFEHLASSLTKQFNDEVRIICGDYQSLTPSRCPENYREVHFFKLGKVLIPTLSTLKILYQASIWADVVYFSFGFFGQDILMLGFKLMTGTRMIVAIHAPLLHQDKWHNLSVRLISRWLLPFFDGVHLLAKTHSFLLDRWGVKRMVIIPCGIDLQAFPFHLGGGNKKFTVLFVGRLEKQKGADLVLEIVKQLPKINFVIAGEGTYQGEFIKVSQESKNVKYLGFVPHDKLPSIYAQADLLLFPSREETSPAVLFEAQATGLPVLATPLPEIKEVLGKEGIFVSDGSPSLWAKRLTSLMAFKQNRRKLRDRSENFEFGVMVKKLRNQLL